LATNRPSFRRCPQPRLLVSLFGRRNPFSDGTDRDHWRAQIREDARSPTYRSGEKHPLLVFEEKITPSRGIEPRSPCHAGDWNPTGSNKIHGAFRFRGIEGGQFVLPSFGASSQQIPRSRTDRWIQKKITLQPWNSAFVRSSWRHPGGMERSVGDMTSLSGNIRHRRLLDRCDCLDFVPAIDTKTRTSNNGKSFSLPPSFHIQPNDVR